MSWREVHANYALPSFPAQFRSTPIESLEPLNQASIALEFKFATVCGIALCEAKGEAGGKEGTERPSRPARA